MVSSTDGWIVGADGVYRWQENGVFPIGYLIIIIVVFAVIVVAWFLFKKKIVLSALK
jgi:predicted ABC-type sugar transport system permease subunit